MRVHWSVAYLPSTRTEPGCGGVASLPPGELVDKPLVGAEGLASPLPAGDGLHGDVEPLGELFLGESELRAERLDLLAGHRYVFRSASTAMRCKVLNASHGTTGLDVPTRAAPSEALRILSSAPSNSATRVTRASCAE